MQATVFKNRLPSASSAQVADCMPRLGAMDAGIKPIWSSPRKVGPAPTVWCHAGDNLMLHKALSLAAPGDIIVVNTQGNLGNAGFGELIATSAVKLGVLGVIVDGLVRDAEGHQALGLPVYAAGSVRMGAIRMARERSAPSLLAAV